MNQYVSFGNGVDAVASGPDSHQTLLGKDRPHVATKTYQDATVTKWTVEGGGRRASVLGEIDGSVPVPPVPSNPTPIGG